MTASVYQHLRLFGAPGQPLLLDDGAVAVADGAIVWAGPRQDLPPDCRGWPSESLGGRLLTPALIDCHTHLVHGGNRAAEFEQRLAGASYEAIARAGGGIAGTVAATRALDEDALVAAALPGLDAMLAEGLAVIEIKSGYGLERDTELRMLRAATRLGAARGVTVSRSYLGAHAVPAEYAGRADDYLDEVCLPTLDAALAEGLVDAVDGFCEPIAFSAEQIRRLFTHARGLGLPVKLHAEQLSHQGAARLAAGFGALSVDHLECLPEADVPALAAAGTVAVLLPGAFYSLRETRLPPVAALRAAGVPMAVASDCNPGSSPLYSPLLAMHMACTLFGLSPLEALQGMTLHAARALGLQDRHGAIAPGMAAEFCVWDAADPAELIHRIGFNPLHRRIAPLTREVC